MPIPLLAQTQSQYVDALTLGPSEQFREIEFFVSAPNSVLYQIAKDSPGGKPAWDDTDLVAQPGQGGFSKVNGIRFKNYGANPSVILAVAYFHDDPVPLGTIPSSNTLSTSGQSGGGVVNLPIVIVRSVAVQTFGNNGGGTGQAQPCSFDTVDFDPDGFFNILNPTYVTVPTGFGGKYLFTGNIGWAANAAGFRTNLPMVNLVGGLDRWSQIMIGAAGYTPQATVTAILNLNVGDKVSLGAYQNSGGNLNTIGNQVMALTMLNS